MASDKRPKRDRHEEIAGSQLRDLVAEQLAEQVAARVTEKLNDTAAKVEQKLTKKLQNAQRRSERATRHLEVLEHASSRLAELDVWTRLEPGSRRPRFSREDIAAAAMRIADAEGFEAVSMRRIANELGVGTMTLYHYVRTKDELLTLLHDAVMGEVVVPDDEPLPDDWRAALSVIAHRTRDAFRRHRWVMDVREDPGLGPNSVRHFDQSLAAVANLPVDLATKLEIMTVVDEFVFGTFVRGANGDVEIPPEMIEYTEALVATGEYPQLAKLVHDPGLAEAWRIAMKVEADDSRFDRNLQRLLDGIEASLPAPVSERET